MRLKQFLLIAIISIALLCESAGPLLAARQADLDAKGLETSEEYSFRISVEKHLESKLNTVLREVTGIKRLVAVVDADVEALPRPQEDKRVDTEDINVLFLPGVPARPESTYFADSPSRPPVVVRKLAVKVMVDRKVSSGLTGLVHDVAISLVGFNPDRGDTLEVQAMEFMDGDGALPTHVLYTAIVAVPAIFFMIAAGLFFLAPYKKLTLALKEAGLGQDATAPRDAVTPAAQGAAFALPPTLAPAVAAAGVPESGDTADSGISRHFGFLGSMSADDIMFALRELEPAGLAIALNYMAPELSAEVLGRLDEPLRKETVASLALAKVLGRTEVLAVEDALREKLEFISGGPARMAAMLENTDEDLRDSLLDAIESKNKEAALAMGRMMVTFESIIRKSSAASVDTLVRRFAPASFARVLAAAPADVQGKVLDSLGRGASELMREELKYATPLRQRALRLEKRRIVDEFRAISSAGIIDEQILDMDGDGA